MLEKLFRPVAAFALTLGLTASALAAEPLKIGTTSAFAIPLEAAVEEAHKQGLEVKLIEFSDWIAPNVSLNSGDIDVNYFQHIPFLENAKAAAGFNLTRTVTPESFEDFIDLVIPQLQQRGRYKTAYAEGTLREKLFDTDHPHLPASHPGSRYRFTPTPAPTGALHHA